MITNTFYSKTAFRHQFKFEPEFMFNTFYLKTIFIYFCPTAKIIVIFFTVPTLLQVIYFCVIRKEIGYTFYRYFKVCVLNFIFFDSELKFIPMYF